MVFKSVDGHFATIFDKVQKINTGFGTTKEEISDIVNDFNELNKKQDIDALNGFYDDIASKNSNVADMFRNIAKQGATATASAQDFYAAILDGNTSGFMNVKSVIETFNLVDPSHQQDFANAVGTTNANLGQYLSNVQVGSASMQGYGKQLVVATAKTVGLKVATVALNAAISLGITGLVSLAVYGVSKLIGISKEISEGIANANDAYSKTSESIKSIEEYKTKITELKNALADETTSEEEAYNIRKQLLEIQDDLVTKYGLQKDSIDLVNGSLREEIELLDEVSRKKSSDFLRENKESIDNAKKKVEKEKSFNVNFTKSGKSELSDFQDFLLSQGIMSQRTDRAGITSLVSDFTGTTDEAIEHYTKLFDCIQKYKDDNISVLSQSQDGLSYIEGMLTGISKKINAINNEDYKNAKQLYDSATQSELQTNDNYRNIYKATLEAREDFQSGIASGNENAINKSLEDMEKAKSTFREAFNNGTIVDNGVTEWFNNFYNDFETESGKYQFKVDITANSDGLNKSVQEALSYFGNQTPTKLDILNLEFKGSEQAQSTFQSLNSIAEQYGMTIEDLISILEDLEIVQIDEKDVDVTASVISTIQGNLTRLKAEIEDIFKNTDLFDGAIEALNKGESIDFDTVMSIVEIDSSLANKFIRTADGYTIAVDTLITARQKYTEETRASTQADIESAKQTTKIAEQNIAEMQKRSDSMAYAATQDHNAYQAKKELDEAIQTEKEHVESLNGIVSESTLILSEMNSAVMSGTSYFEKSQNAISGMEEKTSLLKKAMTEMRDAGSISADTYAELASRGEDYVNCLEIQNGKLVLNTEKLKDLDTAALKAAITTNELAMAQINASMAGHEWSEALTEEYNKIELATAALRDKLNEYNNTKPDDKSSSSSSSDNDKPQSVLDFEKELARREHEIKMGRMKEDEDYFNWLDGAYKKAYEGVKDCQDDLYKYEEMIYEGRKKLAEDFYNDQKKYHENRVSDLEAQIDITTNNSVDKNGNDLKPAEKFDYLRDIYDEILAEIERRENEIIQSGIEGHEDELAELARQYEEYADKKADIFKDEIDYEKEYIESLQDKYNDFIEKRIDRYEDEKDAVESRYDSEIDAIDKTIKALKNKNEEDKTALDLAKAKQELESAKQRTRKVYGAGGAVEYRQDTDKISEAQQKVNDLEQEQIINSFEKLKESLEDQKKTEVDKYDSMIDSLNEQKDKQSDYYDSLLKILNAYLNPEANENLDTVFERILGDTDKVKTSDGTTAVNGNAIDTSGIDKGKLNGDKVNNNLEQMGKWLRSIGIGEDSIEKLTKNPLALIGIPGMQHNSTAPNIENWTANRDNYTINNDNTSQPVNVTFEGGINIQEPVGEVHQFAKELLLQLPTAFKRQMYTNLK